jgi:hypothetical protein
VIISSIKKYLLASDGFFYKFLLAPISAIKKNKNFKTIFSYPVRIKNASFSNFKYALYFDNEDPGAVLQIDKWFSQNFFKKDETLVLFRIYSSSVLKHIDFLENNNYNFYGFRVLKHFDLNKSNIKFIFYAFNSFTNPVLIKNQKIKHIWIAHGESDKLASVNPMIRMYDYIFVAGDIAQKRLLESHIINRYDIESQRVLKIGLPYLEKKSNEKKSNEIKRVLYAPTWEGVELEQQYSSLKNDFGLNVLKFFQRKYLNIQIDFKPHPSTSIKDKNYSDKVKRILDLDVKLILDKNSYLYSCLSYPFVKEDFDYLDYDLIITDNSSIIANIIYYKINYIVLMPDFEIKKESYLLLGISTLVKTIKNIKELIQIEFKANKDKRYKEVIEDLKIENNKLLEYLIDKNLKQGINY